jgi:hypothetical protein
MNPPNGTTAVTPLPAPQALDAYFLEARAKLLDLAAILDRIGRGVESGNVAKDPRLEKIHQAFDILKDQSGGRAERIQQVFSLNYEAGWKRPQAR